MRKDSYEETLVARNPLAFSFSDIAKRIDYSPYEKAKTKKRFGWAYGIIGGAAALGVTLGIVFSFVHLSPKPSPSEEASSVKTVAIQNPEDLVREYEKNCGFVSDSLVLSKKFTNGKRSVVPADEYTVDASSFHQGMVGEYEIGVFLKGQENARTSYSVNVVDDEVKSLSIGDHRSVYYLGESPIPQDLVLRKLCESGSTREAKPAEYFLELGNYNSQAVGTYTVGVSLKSNVSFSLSYEVEVKGLEEADLDGRYAYVDYAGDYGQPTIYALDLANDVVSSRYSEILLNGKLNREIKDGEIHLSRNESTQTMIYKPAERTLLVSGIAGDPDMPCFRLNRTDVMITLIGSDEADKDTKFVAIDGRLSLSALDYFTYRYGGIYLDANMNESLTHDHVFEADALAYVGVRPTLNEEKPFLGIWYREDPSRNREVAFHIEEFSLYYGDPSYPKTYNIQDKGDGVYWIRIPNEETLVYHSAGDILEILSFDTGLPFLSLKRFNQQTQALVTLRTTYRTIIDYAVDKGTSFQTVFMNEDTIEWYRIPSYSGGVIENDVTFTDVDSCMIGLSDFSGLFGTIRNNVQIIGSWEAGRFPSAHAYWIRFVSDYQETKLGWLGFEDYDFSNGSSVLRAHFDDGSTQLIGYYSNTVEIEKSLYRRNNTPWSGFEFVGSYVSQDGKNASLLDTATLFYKTTYASGYVANCYYGVTLTSLGDERADGYYIYQDEKDHRLERSVLLEKIAGVWNLTFDGVTYVWSSGVIL